MTMKTRLFAIFALLLSADMSATEHTHGSSISDVGDWVLSAKESRLSFVSVKAGDVGEAHRFKELAGELTAAGELTLAIDLASVDTAIEIRDQRMRESLFETEKYPSANLRAQIDMGSLSSVQVGDTTDFAAEAELELHGQTVPLQVQVTVARLSKTKIMVSSAKPVILSADAVGLGPGVEKLRQIAGLSSISKAVPVSFVLTFVAESASLTAKLVAEKIPFIPGGFDRILGNGIADTHIRSSKA